MSVIVRGMEMPYGCADCDFCGGIIMPDGIYCCDCPTEASHGKNISDAINNDARADFCPLAEIPTPHGRLGDLDALYEEISNGNKAYNGIEGYDGEYQHIGNVDDCMDVIKMADAVIEAEGREE